MYKCECGFIFEYPDTKFNRFENFKTGGIEDGEIEVCPKCGSEWIKELEEE